MGDSVVKKKITIAIDGWSSCGKSTLAKDLAKKLNYIYVDSGAMYRGVTLFALQRGFIKNGIINQKELLQHLPELDLEFKMIKGYKYPVLHLNGELVEKELRTGDVPKNVSEVATIKEVRKFLVNLQRKWGEQGGVVMDGRDIGSVVFPNAELKFFITAAPEIRANRRFKELLAKGEKITFEEVEQNLAHRDKMDKERKESPLKKTADAIEIDNSDLTQSQQLALVLDYANETIKLVN
jgi:cytidylate kinase